MNIINREQIYKALLLLPYLFAVTGMLVWDSGDKKLIPIFLISIIVSILIFKKETILNNIRSPFVWLIGISSIYIVFSYYYHGASSREIRALIGTTLFLICFPYQILTRKVILWIVLIGSFTLCINSIYFNLYMNIERNAGYMNPIPYATACSLISIVSFSLILGNSSWTKKALPSIAFLLSWPPIILSEARGIWLALALSIILIIIIRCINNPPSKNQLLLAVIFTTISSFSGTFLFKDKLSQRYESTIIEIQQIHSNDYNTSFGLRLQMWMLAPELIQKKPLFGHGHEQQLLLKEKLEHGEITRLLFRYASAHYHNQILDKIVKNGIIGLVLLLGILVYPTITIKNLRPPEKYIVAGLVSLFFIAGLTDVPFNHPQPLMLYLLFLVPICSRYKRVTND